MGRKSKLTEKQWEEIGKRLLNEESGRALAKEFQVSEAAIRKRFGAQVKEIKDVANQIVETDKKFKALPISAQISARTLADRLIAISDHLAGAAEYGAATAHRLAAVANAQAEKIDDATPIHDEDSLKALKGIAALTQLANESSKIGLNLLHANRESMPTDGNVIIEGGLPED